MLTVSTSKNYGEIKAVDDVSFDIKWLWVWFICGAEEYCYSN